MQNNPKITVIVLCYNQENFIVESLRSILEQTYTPMEVVVSDDCSNDSSVLLINSVIASYNGPITIKLNVNEVNVGLISNLYKAVGMSTSDIIVLAAGDDISLPYRVESIKKAFELNPKAFSVSGGISNIDENGKNLCRFTKIQSKTFDLKDLKKGKPLPILGCSRAYKRSLFSDFPDISSLCPAEDIVLVHRALLLGDIIHVNEEHVLYRQLESSLSRKVNNQAHIFLYNQFMDDLNFCLKNNIISTLDFKKIKIVYQEIMNVSFELDKLKVSKLPIFTVLQSLISNNLRISKKLELFTVALKLTFKVILKRV